MSFALNNQWLVLRDIKNFSEDVSAPISDVKENVKANKKEVQIRDNEGEHKFATKVVMAVLFVKNIGKIMFLNLQLYRALNDVNSKISSDYSRFIQSDHRTKEDLLIKWERLARILNAHAKKKTDASFLTKGIVDKTMKIIDNVNCFIGRLTTELYPNINKPLSQKELKELAKKFEHMPKDMLKEIVSDEILEAV